MNARYRAMSVSLSGAVVDADVLWLVVTIPATVSGGNGTVIDPTGLEGRSI